MRRLWWRIEDWIRRVLGLPMKRIWMPKIKNCKSGIPIDEVVCGKKETK